MPNQSIRLISPCQGLHQSENCSTVSVSQLQTLDTAQNTLLRISAGLGVERARIVQDGPAEDFELLSLPMTLDRDGSDDPTER